MTIDHGLHTHLNAREKALAPNRPLVHTYFTYPKLNMDDFSALYGAFVYVEGTREVKRNSLHAEWGIGKEEKTVKLSITFIN